MIGLRVKSLRCVWLCMVSCSGTGLYRLELLLEVGDCMLECVGVNPHLMEVVVRGV